MKTTPAVFRQYFDKSSPARLMVLTAVLLALWAAWGGDLSEEETRLYRKVREAQNRLWEELESRGVLSIEDEHNDPDKSGFVGVEWSSITTTLGSLESKRNAGDPLWAVQTLRWLDGMGIGKGDRIVVLSSSSFPGMLFSVLAAAETRGIAIDLAVSLGSSTWGANRRSAPWPLLGRILREHGFLATKPRFYTLGGGGENGGGIPGEGIALLENAARDDGVNVFRAPSVAAVIDRKMSLIEDGAQKAKLVVNIGGSEANLGHDEAAIRLSPGLLPPETGLDAGDGVIGLALKRGYPVLHLLNLRLLANKTGIAFHARRPSFGKGAPLAAAGVALFAFVMITHRRWTWS
ncbi:MAG: poly-gamma-glutamate system protein [Synergistaceae bacterium]|jgi:poly-gamma-glutamate system protein|nr:poly-gamma-glutamate system protein [Synergistaceae bacterium]